MAIDLITLGSTEFLVPFFFCMATVFGVLEITKLFRKPVNFIIAITLSIFALWYPGFVEFLWANFGLIAIFFIALFFIVFIYKVFGVGGRNTADAIVINGAILFVLLSISYLYMNNLPGTSFFGGAQNLILLIALALIISIFWAAYKTGGSPQK